MHLSLVVFFLSHYGFLAIFTLLAYLLGRACTLSITYSSASEKFSFCTGLGLGLIATIILGLGLAHALTRDVVLTVFLAVGVLAALPTWKEVQSDVRNMTETVRSKLLWYLIGLAVIFPIFLLPLYPPTQWDAISYHLAAAKIYATSHAVVFTQYLRFPVFPQLNEMLFSLMLLLYDDISAQLVQFLMMWLVAMTLYAWGRHAFNGRVGLWAAVLWISNPMVLWLGASAYIDIGLTMFVLLAAFAFFNWFDSREASWLKLSAALFGFAAGSKYLALFPVAIFGLFLSCWAIRNHRFRELLGFAVIVAVVASPWYIRNVYYTGNPVWPYFGSKFGYGIWSAEDLKAQLQEQTSYGVGKTLMALIMLPWNVVFHASLFHADLSVSPAYSLSLPLYLIAAWRNKYLRAVFLVAGLYTLFWFSTVQILRYLLLALPFFSLAAVAAVEKRLSRFSNLRTPLVSSAVTGGICVLLLTLGWYRAAASVPRSLPPSTPIQRAVFLRQALPAYSGYEFLNHAADGNYSIYALGGSNMAYFAGAGFMGDWFGPARYSSVLNKLSDPEELYRHLRSLSADYLLISLVDMPLQDRIVFPAFFDGHFRLLYANPHVLLFHIEEKVVHLAKTADLLSNGGFEMLNAGVPLFWTVVGRPLVGAGAKNSYNGNVAVRADSNSWLVQRVPVEGGEAYILRELNRATEPLQSSRLQVNWLDCQQKMLNPDISVVPAEAEWRLRLMATVAPSSACWADIYVSVQGDSKVWLDDFSFHRLKYQ